MYSDVLSSSTECVTFSLVWAFSEVTERASVRLQIIYYVCWGESVESFKALNFGGDLFAFFFFLSFFFLKKKKVILSRASASLFSNSM